MISAKDLLFIEPKRPASSAPVLDHLTRQMTAAYRAAHPSPYCYAGTHTCVCGVRSSACDYFLPNAEKTNSLCVHYMAYHREEVPHEQLERVAALRYGEIEPAAEELQGGRWRGN